MTRNKYLIASVLTIFFSLNCPFNRIFSYNLIPVSFSNCTLDKGWTQRRGLYDVGQVLDKSTRVQVQVLKKMTSTSTNTSTGFSKVLKYKYKYFKKYLSTEYFGCKL